MAGAKPLSAAFSTARQSRAWNPAIASSSADGGERFHLDTGLVDRAHPRLDGQLTAPWLGTEGDVDAGDAQGMAQRNQLRRPLGREDPRRARDPEHIALGRVALADGAKGGG